MRHGTNMSLDPFSDILKFTNAETVVSGGFSAGGAWALRFPAPDKIKFFALIKGGCWLMIDGDDAPVRVEAGDVFLLSAQRTFILASDLSVEPVMATTLFSGAGRKFATLGDGADCIQIGGHVRLDPVTGNLLSDVLPSLIHVKASAPQAAVLKWLLDQMVQEGVADLPGSGLALSQIAQLMFVQLLRAHLSGPTPLAAGWLRALGDPRLALALHLMHADPGRAWHLEELASAVAMSRTTFASRFKAVAGVPPLTYLLNWRMRLAQRALREGGQPVAMLALSLGYTSESAFSNAFKRAIGVAPKRFRDAARFAMSGRRGATAPVLQSSLEELYS